MLHTMLGRTFCTLIASLVFAACAPGTQSPSAFAVLESLNPTYLPHEVGSWWSYLPEAEEAESPTVTMEIIGRTLVNEQPVTMWEIQGRGLERILHRYVNDEGMFLVREVRPEVTLTFQPPLQELPAIPLSVGQRWDGETTVRISTFAQYAGEPLETRRVNYTFTVIGSRDVQLATATVEVFEIHFAASESTEEDIPASQYEHITWFVPYVGEIRTSQGYLLQASNLLP